MLKKKSKVNFLARFIAMFMTVVLTFTIMPVKAKAASRYTVKQYYEFDNLVSIEALYKILDEWSFYVVETDTFYKLELISETDTKIGIEIPTDQSLTCYLYGKHGINRFVTQGVGTGTYVDFKLYVHWYMDGTEVLDCVLWYMGGYDHETYIPKPEKEGYVFTGWVDKKGNPITGNAYVDYYSYETGQLSTMEAYIYATWKLHEHQWNVDEWSNDDDCHWHECVAEGCPIKENSEKDGYAIHEMSEWEIVTEAKFKEDGLKKRNCQICGYEEEEIIPKLSDSHVHEFEGREEVIIEPKCYELGLKYVYCTLEECGEYEEQEIAKIAHDYEEDWRYNEIIHYHKCKNCTDCIDEINHKITEWKTVVEPEFNKDGLKERHCEDCEYKELKKIQKLSDTHIHDYKGPEEIITDSTCTEEGLKKVHCYEEQCEAYIEKSIPKKEHKFDVGWKYDEDMHYHECIYCEAHGDDDGYHDMFETGMVKLATKDSPGIMELECVKCRYVDYAEVPYVEEPKEETNPEIKEPQQGVIKDDLPPFTAPDTGEIKIVHIYATLAMIGGMTYLLLYFKPINVGMTEETKKKLVDKLIKWAKSRNRFVKAIALFAIAIVLFYYHFISKFIKQEDTASESVDTL